MIRSLVIGQPDETLVYSELIKQINYFSAPQCCTINDLYAAPANYDLSAFDAVLLVSQLNNAADFFEKAIRQSINLYFKHQNSLNNNDLQKINKLHFEADNLLYPEMVELKHPLIEDFIVTSGKHLLYRYNKDIKGKNEIADTLLNALSFITVLSPMQVKKIDINTIESTENGRPAIRIRLKLFDSSIGYIILKQENNHEHNILIESLNGNFTFNFSNNYLENTHGTKFMCDKTNTNDLTIKTLQDFALCIIMNKKPIYNFFHYSLVFKLLKKIENILHYNT